jgi:hypothetical protein
MPILPLAYRNALRDKLLALADAKKQTFLQCRDKLSGTFYRCQLVSAQRHARGIRLILNRVIDSCHWRVGFYQIDNITFLTKTEAHQTPHAWTPSPRVKRTPTTVPEHSRVTRATRRRSPQSQEVPVSAASGHSPPLVSSRTAIAHELTFSESPLTSTPQLSATRTPCNTPITPITPNSHELFRTPAPQSPYGFDQTLSDLTKIASEPLPRTSSIAAADRGVYVDLTHSPKKTPSPVPTIQMVCKHGRLGKCPRCAALDLNPHTDI